MTKLYFGSRYINIVKKVNLFLIIFNLIINNFIDFCSMRSLMSRFNQKLFFRASHKLYSRKALNLARY